MEEAYTELYCEFLRLRSLCLKQAALLQQLTKAMQKEQGNFVGSGGLSDMDSIPVQYNQESPKHLHEVPEPLKATAQNLTALHETSCISKGAGTFSGLLAKDMGTLNLEQRKEDGKVECKALPFLALDSPEGGGALGSSHFSQSPRQVGYPVREATPKTCKMAWSHSSFLDGEFLIQTDGVLMSELPLQSQVCEFCQAVFPGDTTTRGEFLRHLSTHIT
ncbi:TRAF family member-associated NF-kappa-B activator [Lampris incognitus]|uniref:TRAF family member-associated NF-kappa-B activator n=1 Tax=Lampris incognitus TaxID=2546036 RepID=UPI0024B5562D|nr:TRAF family member-associated NF-kappa-B activator [Lampris incognitus]